MHNLKKNMYTSNIYYMNPVSRDFPTHELVEVLFLKQYGLGISFYYIVSDEIPEFFLLLKIISSSRAVKILFLSFTCEDISVAMVTNMI